MFDIMILVPHLTGLIVFFFSVRYSFAQTSYAPHHHYSGSTFFDNFTFFTASDPTNGYVQYVDQPTAQQNELISTAGSSIYVGVDHNTTVTGSTGRQSVRIYSNNVYDSGLFIGDFSHMPGGQWPLP